MIAEAAKIGCTATRSLAQFWFDQSGLMLPIVNEELFWGDAGIEMSIMGTSLAVAAIFGQGTPEQMAEWIRQCFGTADDPKVAAFCSSELMPAPTCRRSAPPRSTTRPMTSG